MKVYMFRKSHKNNFSQTFIAYCPERYRKSVTQNVSELLKICCCKNVLICWSFITILEKKFFH